MLHTKIIDLSNYKKGVTMYFKFKNVSAPFYVFIMDAISGDTFYKRLFDKKKLEANLPVHSSRIQVITNGTAEIENYIVGDLRIQKINYSFNPNRIVHRPYPISHVSIRSVKIPYESPARFLPALGIIEQDPAQMGQLSQPTRNWILNHELGHYWYGEHTYDHPGEKEADRFALYAMINQGYNYSGIMQSMKDSLNPSHYNLDRIEAVVNEIRKQHPEHKFFQ